MAQEVGVHIKGMGSSNLVDGKATREMLVVTEEMLAATREIMVATRDIMVDTREIMVDIRGTVVDTRAIMVDFRGTCRCWLFIKFSLINSQIFNY